MERARELGYARSIGVSNFSVGELEEVLAVASIAPVVNQVQFSPFEYRRALLEACRQRGVALEAYSPLGTGRHLSDETVSRVAQRVGRTPAQVLLRWCLQRDVPVIPKSTHRERIEENAQIFDFSAVRPRTWPSSTRSTRPAAPTAPSNASGGRRPAVRAPGEDDQPQLRRVSDATARESSVRRAASRWLHSRRCSPNVSSRHFAAAASQT